MHINPRTIYRTRTARLLLDSIANHVNDLQNSVYRLIDGDWIDIQPGDKEWRELVTLGPATIEYLNDEVGTSTYETVVNTIIRTSDDEAFMIYGLSVFDVIGLE